jgi:hypothetical protein
MTTLQAHRRSVATALFAMAAPLLFAAAMGIVLLLPIGLALPICSALYAVSILGEARCGTYALQSLALGGYFAACALASGWFQELDGLQRGAGTGGLALLFLLSLASAIFGTPLHGGRPEVWEPRQIRRVKAGAWLVICPMAIALWLLWQPEAWVPWAQFGLATSGAAAAGIVDLWYCGALYRRGRDFTLGGFRFREIELDADALTQFFDHYTTEIATAVSRDRRAEVKYSRSEIFEAVSRTEQAVTAQRFYFNAYDGDKIVGGIAVALDGADHRLPVEKSYGISFDPLRRYGRIMEVRRLSVDSNYRFQPDIFRGLVKCAIEVGLENDVSFMVDLAFHFVVNLLRKAGFEELALDGRKRYEFGSPVRVIAQNLAIGQLESPVIIAPRKESRYAANPCLRYRYYRRAMMNQAWWPERSRVWSLSSADMNDLVTGGDAAPSVADDAGRSAVVSDG